MKRRDFIALTGLGAVLATLPGFSASADEPKKKVLYYDYAAGFIHPPTIDNDGKLGVCGSFLKEPDGRAGQGTFARLGSDGVPDRAVPQPRYGVSCLD